MSTDIAPQVPELLHGAVQPHETFTSQDVSLPQLKIGQLTGDFATSGLVNFGEIFTALSRDDPDPEILAAPAERKLGALSDPPVRFFVLSAQVTYSYKGPETNDEFRVYDEGDPETPAKAKRGYKYIIAVPDANAVIPYRFGLYGASVGQAKAMNLLLAAAGASGNSFEASFELRSKQTKNDQGTFCVAQVAPSRTPITDEEREVVHQQFARFAQAASKPTRRELPAGAVTDAPAI